MKENIIKKIKQFFIEVSDIFLFAGKYFEEVFKKPLELNETLKQFYYLGNNSLPLVSVTGLIIGLTLAIQLKPTMAKFGAESLIPNTLAIAVFREIGPVITALICAGKMGSGIGAELGSMKVSEQIAAMEVSSINPFKYLVVTRITAATLMVPLLVIYSNTLSLAGGYIATNLAGDMSLRLYWSKIFNSLYFEDIVPSTIKTFSFGFVIGLIGCYKGYNCSRGTESVGKAANSSVVMASFMVIFLDLIAVQISSILF
jgi:phospholipid/cholesterol/gamma-HCH transport system permease protein